MTSPEQQDQAPLQAATRPIVGIFYPMLGAFVAAVVVAALGGAGLSGWIAGTGWAWPPVRDLPEVVVGWVSRPTDPAAAWPRDPRPGPAVVTYALIVVLAVGEAALWAWFSAWRARVRRRRNEQRSGLADRATVLARLGAAAVLATAVRLRPSLANTRHIGPDQAGARFAQWPGTDDVLYGTHEDSKIVEAPSRMGKTNRQAVFDVLLAPGAVVATSTRFDLVELTIMERAKRGKVWVFDPENRTPWPYKLRWNPIRGCEDYDVALRRAVAICAARPLEDTKNGGYFSGQSEGVLAAMLHAAALSGSGVDVLRQWTNTKSYRPAQILDTDDRAAPAVGEELRNILDSLRSTSDTSGAGGIYSTLSLLLRPLASPETLRALTVAADDEVFDVDEFIRSGRDTLYMISRGRKNSAAPMVNALMVEVLHRADILSQHPTDEQLTEDAHGDLRLDPPLRVVMDEASNITPVEDLGTRLADSGGRGVQLYVYIQSPSQLRQRWGPEGAVEIWDNASIKLVLGGLSNAKDLRDISELLGDRHVDQASVSTGRQSHDQVTVSTRTERALAVDAIRELRDGEALLLYRNMRAAKVRMPGTWEVPHIDRLVTASRRDARRIIAGSTGRGTDGTPRATGGAFRLPTGSTGD